MIAFSCSHCQKSLKVKDELAGKRIRCPGCQQVQEVPHAEKPTSATTRSRPGVAEDATLPPASRPAPRTDDATLPPRHSLAPGATVTHQAAFDEQEQGFEKETVKGAFAYEVEAEIARGGMGAVMRAVDQDIRREVAVKFLLNHADERLKARFVEEAQITGQLEHPNIVPIHQLGVHEDGRCFFSMKMVKGRSLAEILKGEPGVSATGEFTLGRLLTIFTNICNALAYAHARGVIHRDLKPANVMVGDFGEVYVMDWGLAKALGGGVGRPAPSAADAFSRDPKGSAKPEKVATQRAVDSNLTQDGSIIGTPAYMPPEQARGDLAAIDERSDIYSLGAILYEIMTLSPPVGRSGDHLAILMRVMEGAIEPPEKMAPERARKGWIPSELSAMAMKALALDPADRYPSVEAVQRDIQRFIEGRSVSAKQDSAWEMFKKLVKRNKGVSIATAAALVLLAAGKGIAFYFINEERQEAVAARDKAEENYNAFLNEQREKKERMKKSAPAFLRAAHLTANEKDFKTALDQVNVALDSDAELGDAYLLKGQLLIGLERYSEAVGPLQDYLQRKSADGLAGKLAELAAKPEPNKGAYLWALWEVFDKQKALPLAERMTRLAERVTGPQAELLAVYRKRIEAVPGWAGKSHGLFLDKNGNLSLSFFNQGGIRDLSPLKGMKLATLNLYGTAVEDLKPLEGMPLTSLNLGNCAGVKDVSPLRGMKLTFLNLDGLGKVPSLEPLRGMPLRSLYISFCHNVPDLEPLRGMPLTELNCSSYGGMKFPSLEPLTGMKLKFLGLGQAMQIKDLGPLRDMPLERLYADRVSAVRDFEALRGRPLVELNLAGSQIRDLEVLRGMPLKYLNLHACHKVEAITPLAGMPLDRLELYWTAIRDLKPLAEMKLTWLDIAHCDQIEDFSPLKNIRSLKRLQMPQCKQLRDLEFLRDLKLEILSIASCDQVHDLTPLAKLELQFINFTPRSIQKGMDILRAMKSLETVMVNSDRQFPAEEFWKLYDKGEFKK